VGAPESGSTPARYLLSGPLPAERPEASAVYRLGPAKVPVDSVRRLARALALGGSTRQNPTGWQVSDGRRVLAVDIGGNWQLGPGEVTMDNPVQCFRAPCPQESTGAGSGVGSRSAPPPAAAKRIATVALHALGLPTEDLRTTPNGRLTDVRASRQVAGRDALDFGTTLSVGGDGKIYSGTGWLGQPERGPAYPLVTAAAAFNLLQAQPHAEIALCRPQADGGCAPAPQVRVTGAKLGLLMAIEERGAVLVPAWLFTIAGQHDPVAAVAVEPRYLALPPATQPGSPPAVRSSGEPSFHTPATPPS